MAIFLALAWFYFVIHGASSNRPPETTDCEDYSDKYTCNGADNKYVCDCYSESVCYFELLLRRHHNAGKENGTYISVNGRFQGPTLIVKELATVVVDVVNKMDQETSIHWHGIHQTNTAWMDGVGNITQWPIEPGRNFRYIFIAKPSGTLWYHSHIELQRTEGLFGALIVREKVAPPLNIDFEDMPGNHTMIFLDYLPETFAKSTNNFKSLDSFHSKNFVTKEGLPFKGTCSPDGSRISNLPFDEGLVNGLGVESNQLLSNFYNAMLKVSSFHVEPSKTYRFRLIGAQQIRATQFSIDDHKLTVIATDGYLLQPYETDYIVIHAGERYDFLLTANSASNIKLFPIRTETLEVDCATGENVENSGYAYLAYGTSNDGLNIFEAYYLSRQFREENPKSCTAETPCKVVNCPFQNYTQGSGYICHNVNELKLLIATPKEQLPISNEIDLQRTMFFNFYRASESSTSNFRQFVMPPMPLQGQNYSEILEDDICEYNASECLEKVKSCIYIAEISDEHYYQSIRFVLSSLGDTNSLFTHPIHLHGHSFHVVKVGYPTYHDNGTIAEPSKDLEIDVSCKNPPKWANDRLPNDIGITNYTVRKDTVMVPAGGYVVIDFHADNPGYWFMHCHIEPHLQTGMATVVREVKAMQTDLPEGMEDPNKDFCWNVEDFYRKIHEAKPPIQSKISPKKVISPRRLEEVSCLSKERMDDIFDNAIY